MDISGTLVKTGQAVNIVSVNVIGYFIYITYVTADSNLKVDVDYLPTGVEKTIATDVTIN